LHISLPGITLHLGLIVSEARNPHAVQIGIPRDAFLPDTMMANDGEKRGASQFARFAVVYSGHHVDSKFREGVEGNHVGHEDD
jgi:hypothetical protein